MALPKKGLRKITVDDFQYAWSATGNDWGIGLTIAPLKNGGQILITVFDYHHKLVQESETIDGIKVQSYEQQFIITPYIIRQVIQYALDNGWKPKEKGPQFNLGQMDHKIEIRLKEKKNT